MNRFGYWNDDRGYYPQRRFDYDSYPQERFEDDRGYYPQRRFIDRDLSDRDYRNWQNDDRRDFQLWRDDNNYEDAEDEVEGGEQIFNYRGYDDEGRKFEDYKGEGEEKEWCQDNDDAIIEEGSFRFVKRRIHKDNGGNVEHREKEICGEGSVGRDYNRDGRGSAQGYSSNKDYGKNGRFGQRNFDDVRRFDRRGNRGDDEVMSYRRW